MAEQKKTKPDIIIDYNYDFTQTAPVAVIYVRPETNFVSYEKAIIKGIQPFADVIFMANLNGQIFLSDALIIEHHSSEFRFAIYGKDEIAKYPEMVEHFENHFKVKFNDTDIIGAFEALIKLNINQEELFNVFVENKDFLRFYGQTIKKIKNYYIINYDIPALIEKYTPKTNVFVIVIKFKNDNFTFKEINYSVSNEIIYNCSSPLIFSENDKFNDMEWIDKVKRTYHFSKNHIVAMFDMIDFVFKNDTTHISFEDTPLGHLLITEGITNEQLKLLKEYPIVYLHENGSKKLVNLVDEAYEKSIEECVQLIKNIFSS